MKASDKGVIEERYVVLIVRETLTALAFLHASNVIHRDIKGANILVDNKGGIKISDFGISKKVEDSELSFSNANLYYMSNCHARPDAWFACAPSLTTRLRVLDGP